MRILRKIKNEDGAVMVVEASFVFPIVFFVVIILIFFGNLMFQQTKVDSIAVRGAEYLSAVYTNPTLTNKSIPTNSTEIDVRPYRYLLGDKKAETKAKEFIGGLLNKTGTGLFSGMDINATIKTCEIKNYVLYQTACVEIEYSIKLLPVRFFDMDEVFKYSSATAVAACDPAEFIRNVDMIVDYADTTGLSDKIQKFVGPFMGN